MSAVRPHVINRLLGIFSIYLVDTEAPELLSTSVEPDGLWVVVTYGNPKTGKTTHQVKAPKGPRISSVLEVLNE
ncbi:MAG: hypothetical protein MUF85_02500 [Patescibacteria group bacterium]|nr:hypothetical protein [Patescibacteria group bacterium]